MVLGMLSYFNSIKVRLRPSPSHALTISRPFQFHKGSIKTLATRLLPCFLTHFNSIKVRLRREGWACCSSGHENFNSIKVRLRLVVCRPALQGGDHFNSIKVRLRPEMAAVGFLGTSHFNSIKVRLRPSTSHALDISRPFQFHKGSIKTHALMSSTPSPHISIP